jgi:hypothetical protein
VYNALFDDAIDQFLLANMQNMDMVFIDGHHEKRATIHYFERLSSYLNPGAIVIFDDISWSQDMRDGWMYLSSLSCFSHAIDCSAIGVCIWDPSHSNRPRYWDVQNVIGRAAIGKPHGWDA